MSDSNRKKRPWRWRRLIQFRLRTVILLMFIACMIMGVWYQMREHVQPFREQKAALAELQDKIEFVATESACPFWLKPFFNEDEFQDVVHLSFLNRYNFKNEDVKLLKTFPRLRKLSLQNTSVDSEGLAEIAPLRHLERLSLKRLRINDDDLVHLKAMQNLQVLHLSYTQVQGDGLKHLAGLPLRELELNELRLQDEHVPDLLRHRRLQRLVLGHHQISDANISRLSHLPRLKALSLHWGSNKNIHLANCPHLEEFSIYSYVMDQCRIENMPRLNTLKFARYRSNRSGVDLALVNLPDLDEIKFGSLLVGKLHLEKLPKITSLELRRSNLTEATLIDMRALTSIDMLGAGVRSPILESLAKLPALESLSLQFAFQSARIGVDVRQISKPERSPLRANELASLAKSKSLRSLDLTQTGVDDRAVRWLAALEQLETLNLSQNPIFDKGIAGLANLQNLQTLDLSRTFASDSCLVALGGMQLDNLSLKRTNVTNAGLAALSKMKSLRHLDLLQTEVNYQGLAHLNPLLNLERVHVGQTPNEAQIPFPQMYYYVDAKRILPFTAIVPTPAAFHMD